ncbi:MAG: DUF4175 family protein [Alphaproteobacteria bacterium]|nr:MAG: DUF4175 family protein [Alphaproteobacteria bacterium]
MTDREPTKQSRFSERLTKGLSMARWISLAVLASIIAIQYVQYGEISFGDRGFVPELAEDEDVQAVVDEVVSQAPDVNRYSNATSIKLVEMGHQLLDEPRYRAYIAKQLHALSTDPELFGDDMTAYLALRMAYWQLRHDPQLEGSAEAALLMWQAAEQIDRVGRYRTARIETAERIR